jgi:hypothetical protein
MKLNGKRGFTLIELIIATIGGGGFCVESLPFFISGKCPLWCLDNSSQSMDFLTLKSTRPP